MSRIGKKPIPLPKGVKITIGDRLEVEGPKGKLSVPIPRGVSVEKSDSTLEVKRAGDQYSALHGLTRALAANAVKGVLEGFTRELEITGIGYRADARDNIVSFSLGYSHPIEYMLPAGITAKVEKQTRITLHGADKQLLGQVAANMRALRPPDPYKHKGVRYAGERLRKKVGKAGAK
jgi:large subunit ribosomal protein L6